MVVVAAVHDHGHGVMPTMVLVVFLVVVTVQWLWGCGGRGRDRVVITRMVVMVLNAGRDRQICYDDGRRLVVLMLMSVTSNMQ